MHIIVYLADSETIHVLALLDIECLVPFGNDMYTLAIVKSGMPVEIGKSLVAIQLEKRGFLEWDIACYPCRLVGVNAPFLCKVPGQLEYSLCLFCPRAEIESLTILTPVSGKIPAKSEISG